MCLECIQWYKKAAEQRHADAQALLGLMYFLGEGVIRDRPKGCALVREAAEQGAQYAVDFYNQNCTAR